MKVTQLYNQQIVIEKGTEPDPKASQEQGELVLRPCWTLILQDRDTKDEIRMTVASNGRDDIVRGLTDGVVLAGGGLPRI